MKKKKTEIISVSLMGPTIVMKFLYLAGLINCCPQEGHAVTERGTPHLDIV